VIIFRERNFTFAVALGAVHYYAHFELLDDFFKFWDVLLIWSSNLVDVKSCHKATSQACSNASGKSHLAIETISGNVLEVL
jgi:hypothetical protein